MDSARAPEAADLNADLADDSPNAREIGRAGPDLAAAETEDRQGAEPGNTSAAKADLSKTGSTTPGAADPGRDDLGRDDLGEVGPGGVGPGGVGLAEVVAGSADAGTGRPEVSDGATGSPAAIADSAWRARVEAVQTARGRASAPAGAVEQAPGTSASAGSWAGKGPDNSAKRAGVLKPGNQRGVAKVPTRRVGQAPAPGLQLRPMVHVADMPAAVSFYEAFGGELVHGDRRGEWVLMQVGTAQIGLVVRPPDPSRGESTVELNFSATMPLDRLEKMLRERDVTIVHVSHDMELGTRLHVETPDGMPIKIHHVEPDLLV
ncbi:VOC family protein [Actinoplanes sp. NPDC051494]|uniref:VOC family protein n=1 Tax=Actinoplanes sp. NPDC051494 TaxID=3363907 RepID=UPI0037BD4EA0